MSKPARPLPRPRRREHDREFLLILIATGQALAHRAPEPEKRHAAIRVTRRLKLLLL